jgi:translation initiation factor IF-3
VRLILSDGAQQGVVTLDEAKGFAEESKLDLVLISPDAEPPVCKIMDYGKHVFELKKQNAANKKKQKVVHIKEMKFRPGTEEGDYQVKLRNLIRFLNDGDRAKVSLRFRGREMAHQELGAEMMLRIKEDLSEHGAVDQEPKMEGRQLTMVLTPLKKKKQ